MGALSPSHMAQSSRTGTMLTLVAISNVAIRNLIVGILSDNSFGSYDEAINLDTAIMHLDRDCIKKYNLILCDMLGGNGHLLILKHVRWNEKLSCQKIPVIGVDKNWTADQIITARDSGINSTINTPLTKRSLHMAIQTAVAKQNSFIISASFRGPDRRAAKISTYKGPFRRSDDSLAQRESKAIAKSQSASNGIRNCDKNSKTVNLTKNTDIVWSANISTGRADIDDEHKKIIEFLRLLGSTSSDEYEKLAVSEVIDGLKEYVKTHFAHEELLMGSFEYDEIDSHKRIHAEFIKKLDKLDINSLRREGGGERLFVLIYNWLVSHIIGIDRVMIAKMTGDYDDGIAIDTVQRQTSVVIGNAYQLAMAIVSSQNNSGTSYISNMENISKLTVRLVNLMELAEMRVRTSGCSDFQLKRLGEIQASLIKTAESLTEYAAEQISTRCTKILMGGNCIPLGLGEVLGHQIGRLFKLAWVAGGVDSLGSSAKSAINRATKLSDEVLALKGLSRTNIADFV